VEIDENQVWDIADHTVFFQVGKLLDLGWTARRAGNIVGVAPYREADNVNALDEAPNSSWFTNRHAIQRLSAEELAHGPGVAAPDTTGPWQIVSGKFEGGTVGFTVQDPAGTRYLLKFDSSGNNEMGSSAEVIGTKVLHAAGYNVPKNSVVFFHPSRLRIGPKARVPDGEGGKRPMTEKDLQDILGHVTFQPDGRLRCVASEFLSGGLVGVFSYHGRRRDDSNDRVAHEHRRELRGLRVISSWLNDADRRAANTLDLHVEDAEGRTYLKHYLIDMGSCLGSNNLMPHMPKYGNEYVWDPRTIGMSLVALGLYRKPWEEPLPMSYPSIGYFENQTFRPERWVPTYPNPAFERCTARDGYWGAKTVMSFSDGDIATMVSTARMSDPGAERELTRLLSERRNMIGRYWFGRVSPVDRFWVDSAHLGFVDLGVAGNLATAEETTYRIALIDGGRQVLREVPALRGETRIPVPEDLKPGRYYGFEIRVQRRGRVRPAARVFFYVWEPGRHQIVRVERDA